MYRERGLGLHPQLLSKRSIKADMSRTSALHLYCRDGCLTGAEAVSCECDACAALSNWAQLRDKRAENSQHMGSGLICGGVSTCKFVGAHIFLWSLSEFCSLDLVLLSSYPISSQRISQSSD